MSSSHESTPDDDAAERPDGATVDATLASSLESLDDATNYRDWIVSLAAPHLGTTLLEVGAGHGTFTESFATRGAVCAVEPGEYASSVLSDRFADDATVTVVGGVVSDVTADAFDAAVMINVLEHIEDEADVLADLHQRLTPDGRLILWVPAFELLFSPFDKKLGHHRRYRKQQLIDVVAANGFNVVECKYANLPGWFSWLLLVRILRQEPTNVATVQLFDRFIVPVVRWVETRVRVPFGQSIFLVAQRT